MRRLIRNLNVIVPCLIMLLASPFQVEKVQAQEKNVTTESFYWLRLKPTFNLSEKWYVVGEFEVRRFMFPDRRHQMLTPRITLNRRFENNYSAGAGLLYFRQVLPQDDDIEPGVVRPEIRPYQDFVIRDSWGRVTISHRYRLEERFTRNTENFVRVDGWDFSLRMRYRLQFVFPLISGEDKKDVNLKVSDEIMINAGNELVRNTFNQNRFYVATSTSLMTKTDLEIGFIHWFQQLSTGDDFRSRFIIRATLSYQI